MFFRSVQVSIALLAAGAVTQVVNSGNQPLTYQALPKASKLVETTSAVSGSLVNSSYSLTGFGAGSSRIHVGLDGALIYTPTYTERGVGYATSYDYGQTWKEVLPAGKLLTRAQTYFQIADGRYFYWSSGNPGLTYAYSDDLGKTWTVQEHFHESIQDWTRMAVGKPVTSKLTGGATQIMYMTSPFPFDLDIEGTPLHPENERVWKSTDKGTTWVQTKGNPTIKINEVGGPCGPVTTEKRAEMIIWGDGIVRANGTVMFGLRRCGKASVAISHDEGDSWTFSDVPSSHMAKYENLASYYFDGNILAADPLSEDSHGNLYMVWVDSDYSLQLAVSKDGAATWSDSSVLSAPVPNGNAWTYHPHVVHHPTQPGRAGMAYYGSSDQGKTWHGYLAETADISANPVTLTAIITNPESAPLQHNLDGRWDQGYTNSLWDAVEFSGVAYHPQTGDLLGAFAKKMCTADFDKPETFNYSSCDPSWDMKGSRINAPWQGFVGFGHHL